MGTVGLKVPAYSKGGGGRVIISSLRGHCWARGACTIFKRYWGWGVGVSTCFTPSQPVRYWGGGGGDDNCCS